VNGSCCFLGDGGAATAAELNGPDGVVCDAAGNLYIADNGNNRIRKVSTDGIISTVAGNGTCCFLGDGGAATAAELNSPTGVACGAAGNLYIDDCHNNRIRMVTNPSGTGIQQFANSNEISIYPNPAKGIMNVELGIMNETATIEIYNTIGECVHHQIVKSSNSQIDVSNLAEGIYNISISSNEGVVNKRLVIVR
ncbi:MAG: T9SS type A sorting domain-containing protein, partial [Bacteroidia bacterium]